VRGTVARNLETPARAEALLAPLLAQGHAQQVPGAWDQTWIAAVHDAGYLEFLETAYPRWQALPNASRFIHPHAFAHYSSRTRPSSIQGQVGYYLAGGSSPLAEGTWTAAVGSAHAALEACRLVLDGEPEAYALCRPPGHHAYADFGGGFCYLNNTAIAANYLASKLGRVAIIDIDTHHGNGTQSIFYRRDDVHFVSVHGDPNVLFPFYAGYAEERGEGEGEGHNLNLPLPLKTEDPAWLDAISNGMASIAEQAPRALLVSLGFDPFKGDPSADLAVSTEGFRGAGERIGRYRGPVVLVQEGGYLVDKLGENLDAFLDGFMRARHAAAR
ncbi:MAG: histone deacetylase family protein, partial [Variovorax sp.]|nr:histone deacetylase family protein [Variovorax sp.]